MKKIILLSSIALLNVLNTNAQVLYSENFDNLAVGNVGTDVTGQTPGQGGWYTIGYTATSKNNSFFTIVNETGKGKVIQIASPTPPVNEVLNIEKRDLNYVIDTRNTNYNIIKIEFDFFTGNTYTFNTGNNFNSLFLSRTNSALAKDVLFFLNFDTRTNILKAGYSNGTTGQVINLTKNPITYYPVNTWMKFNIYLDYSNKKIYFETPYYNTIVAGNFLQNSTSTNLIQDFKPHKISIGLNTAYITSTQQMVHKFDNVKITALNNVPLSVSEFLNDKFNVFPNPATNSVNITNHENITVDKISIYDVSGKLIKETNYNAESTIQLNIEHLQSGNYFLHLQTNQGTAVKKIVKK